MCQQWFSVIGQTLDVIGFLFIASEWRHVFMHTREVGLRQIHEEAKRALTASLGKDPIDRTGEKFEKWNAIQDEFIEDWTYRGRIFKYGVTLVVLGFVFQAMGSWPGGVPLFGYRSC